MDRIDRITAALKRHKVHAVRHGLNIIVPGGSVHLRAGSPDMVLHRAFGGVVLQTTNIRQLAEGCSRLERRRTA